MHLKVAYRQHKKPINRSVSKREESREEQLSRNNGESIPLSRKREFVTETSRASIDVSLLNISDKKLNSKLVISRISNIILTCSGKYGVIKGR